MIGEEKNELFFMGNNYTHYFILSW